MPGTDATHDPGLRSWVASAEGHPDFPIQNLPVGVFSPPSGAPGSGTPQGAPREAPRGGVAIGDEILDLRAVAGLGLLAGDAGTACDACAGPTLNDFLALGARHRRALRDGVAGLLRAGAEARPALLHRAADCTMHMPARVGDYTDFYVGIHHATNVGRLFRPDNPLLPNYKHVPIGYHGRASSLRVSGVPVRRPLGQRKSPDAAGPEFGPCERLDYELELGVWIGPGNEPGSPIAVGRAAEHVAGYCLLNDWSARDIQAWEYQPLGPFLSKSFQTTISPWIVAPEALAPFRAAQPPRPAGDPRPLPYLLDEADQAGGALDLALEAHLLTEAMRRQGTPPHRLSTGTALHMYWTVGQIVAHHTSNGCNLSPGDLLGSGTISAPTPDGHGSLLEITEGGRQPLLLASGETRRFLEDGDEVLLRARARREGCATIGFGECRAVVVAAAGVPPGPDA